ncbi:hypothetical protein A2837_00370 [Candidatus Kaiserbacteria bacterium RIFCSPHIGHO2_01_FULL_46_22]|uniref:Uncharacterized protein n=1 Tax=Candidatus Kaiserbacteria bacterium RIFCSPHIGHO2_01_FULL_46_22 TaxID=1798475 RepID=A0A1F6BXU7_9BACT|nr:MAG: hypothetical protein A2837_00370 [Candidatus Kaiserbacteria bacterium RIFCSPHIGHO2_01_FULL_46_22]
MKSLYVVAIVALIFGSAAARAVAGNASTDWNSTPGFASPDQQAVDYNRAQQQYLARKGLLGNVTNYTTNCESEGACTTNNQTNLNGVTIVDVKNGDGNVTVKTDTDTKDTDQDNTSGSIDIGTLNLN